MDKKKINNKQFEFLREELSFYQKNNIISYNQKEEILDLYDVNKGLNFIRVLLTIGAVLVGIGVLSFIASNWQVIGKPFKFGIILVAFTAFYYIGNILEESYPKTARSLIYISVLIYGAGIFLIGQMFNYGGDFTSAFLLWTVGILPMVYILRDKIIFTFVHILTLVYLNGYIRFNKIPILVIILIVLFYYFNKYFDYSKMITFFTNIVTVNFIAYVCFRYELEGVYILSILFIVGLLMYYLPIKINRYVFRIVGSIVLGLSGLMLTFRNIWNDLSYITQPDIFSVTFTIVYLGYLLLLTRNGNLISLVFICITIFRYYFDTMYDFMPKSLFFIVGGLILLSFGYYFEKLRKEKGEDNNE